MRGTKAKQIRQIAREIASDNKLPSETQYMTACNSTKIRYGSIAVIDCDRAVINALKKLAGKVKNIPARLFTMIAFRAVDYK